MNPDRTDNGLGTSPEKESPNSAVTMESHQQSEPKRSQAITTTIATNFEDVNGAKGQTSPTAVIYTSLEQKGDPKTVASAKSVETKIIPGVNPIVKTTIPDATAKFTFTFNAPILQDVNTKVIPSINPIAEATVPDTDGKFQFILDTPVPQQSVQSSAAISFLFTREAKESLKEAKFGPVKRRVVKPSQMEDEDDDETPKFPSIIFNLPEFFTSTTKDKKPVEDSKSLPIMFSLAEALVIAPQASKKSAEKRRVIPVNSTLARHPIPTTAAKTIKPKGKLEDDKRIQLILRDLLAEKMELRSQRNALAMEKVALEAKLQGQAEDEGEGGKALPARKDEQARELEDLRAKLVQETLAKAMATSRANRLQQKTNEQVDALREAGVGKAKLLTMIDNQKAELAKIKQQQTGRQAEADIGLANAVLQGERVRREGENRRRENRFLGDLLYIREEEKSKRQILMHELKTKNAELHKAKREAREWGEKLLASSQAIAEALDATCASNVSPSSPSRRPQTSISMPPPSSTSFTAMPWFQPNLFPRRLLIPLFIFLLAFVVPVFHFNSLSQPATEESEVWPTKVVGSRDHRIIQEARLLAMWEHEDPVTTAEEGWRRTREAARGYDGGF